MNNHLQELQREIDDLGDRRDRKKKLFQFVEKHFSCFPDNLGIGFYETTIIIRNPMVAIQEISSLGQSGWLRVPEGKEDINWEKVVDGFTITLRNMEKVSPIPVPLNAWPIQLEKHV